MSILISIFYFLITAVGTGGEADESDQVLEAWFAEGSDDSALVMIFRRDLDTEPWAGDPDTDDWLSNSYCITLGSGETIYGGLKQVLSREPGQLSTLPTAWPPSSI
ncbi:immunity protein 7-domain-containing protein [Penicillium alfredii]|uniref:Immunity protein 7-domain-containing protein n=1 Tax=Penicillium alfredii TaxID=1506179 RepID=A0A9W9F914_9EURO|nr:immunity protein 7-domain-containing protein [Penicillium alfredii]KAJ5095704.1 immunity protein 7-domain-containing protein [Penicillium alfredii]